MMILSVLVRTHHVLKPTFNYRLKKMTKTHYALAAQDDWRAAVAKRTHRTVDATPVVLEVVERAEMDPEQVSLDELLK
jgi:hypothetical protein